MSGPRAVVVLNARAAGGKAVQRWRAASHVLEPHLGEITEIFAESKADAITRTRTALRDGAGFVVAAGGDGTVNTAVNGFFHGADAAPVAPDAVLVVMPLGTGNDYTRSIGLHDTDLAAAYARSHVRAVDVGLLEVTGASGEPRSCVFANTAGFGMGSRIAADVGGSAKRFGGWLAYWVGTLRALARSRVHPVRMSFDGEEVEGAVNTVTIGNGRYVGGGMKMAPDARLDDGLLDVVTIDSVGLADFLRNSSRLYAGTHVNLPFVRIRRVRRFQAVPTGGIPVLADAEGDAEGTLPIDCRVLPGAVRVFAPWDDAEAVTR